MEINLNGKTALVTGATGQLGRVMVRTLAACGADVIVHYHRNRAKAEELVEEQEKVAQAELFAKLAADNGIDLNQLGDEQVAQLWEDTFSGEGAEKVASAEEEHYEQPSHAELEFAEHQEWGEKVAEADYLGRVMAHSYAQEMGEIGESMDKDAGIKSMYGAAKGKGMAGLDYLAAKGKAGKRR